jgi:hypothetical protein
MKIPHYTIYNTRHPDSTAHGGMAIIIKSKIKHYELENINKNTKQQALLSKKTADQ